MSTQAITQTQYNNVVFGKANDVDDMFGHFVMDEFHFWSRLLSATEVDAYFQSFQWGTNKYLLFGINVKWSNTTVNGRDINLGLRC